MECLLDKPEDVLIVEASLQPIMVEGADVAQRHKRRKRLNHGINIKALTIISLAIAYFRTWRAERKSSAFNSVPHQAAKHTPENRHSPDVSWQWHSGAHRGMSCGG